MKHASVLHTALILITGFALAACGPSANDGRVGRSALNANVTTTSAIGSACSLPAGTLGRVFDDVTAATGSAAGTASGFESRVKRLISANYDPQYIGTISGVNGPSSTCVTLEGTLHFDSSGQLSLTESRLLLKVYDSLATTPDTTGQPAGAYPIEFKVATSFTKNSDQSYTVVFADSLGQISLTARTVQNQVQGSLQYSNLTSFNGGAGASGFLGAFAISTSSFLK